MNASHEKRSSPASDNAQLWVSFSSSEIHKTFVDWVPWGRKTPVLTSLTVPSMQEQLHVLTRDPGDLWFCRWSKCLCQLVLDPSQLVLSEKKPQNPKKQNPKKPPLCLPCASPSLSLNQLTHSFIMPTLIRHSCDPLRTRLFLLFDN